MINVQEFLLNSNIEIGSYALVTCNNKTVAIYFTKYNIEGNDWFLESPCIVYQVMNTYNENEIREYVCNILEPDEDIEAYIDKYLKHMIVDNVLYEIVNFQYSPFLPEFVDDIKLISERECLEYLLNENMNSNTSLFQIKPSDLFEIKSDLLNKSE